jgi:hypothetical protein
MRGWSKVNGYPNCRECKWFLPVMVAYDPLFRRFFCTLTRRKVADLVTDIVFIELGQCSEVWSRGLCINFEKGEPEIFESWGEDHDKQGGNDG